MPSLRPNRLERIETAPTPVVTRHLPAPDTSKTAELPAVPRRAAASRPPGAARMPAITLRLPAVDPSDPSAETFHTRATPARLPAVRKPEAARLPSTTLRLPALHPEPSDRGTLARLPTVQRGVTFIGGAGETGGARLARWKTPTRVRFLMRLAILPLALVLLLSAQGFLTQLNRDCAQKQAGQSTQSCLALSLFSTLSGDRLFIPPPPPPPGHTAPSLPSIPNNLPTNVHSFIALALSYAIQAHHALGWQTSVILAQWGLEVGWHVPSYTGYNFGNVSSVPGAPTVGGLNVPGSPPSFAYAATPADGLRYYLYAARLSYYTGVTLAARHGADATAVALGESPWDAGHYTAIGQPGSSLLTLMRDFNLYHFDVGG